MSLATLGRYLCRLALAFWLGEMLFFITIFAPRVFKVLPREMAGQLQSSIFPAYYTAGLISALVLVTGLVLRASAQDALMPQGRWLVATWALAAAAAAIFAYSLYSITPELNALRPLIAQDPQTAARFSELHKLSVRVNAAALFALLALLALV